MTKTALPKKTIAFGIDAADLEFIQTHLQSLPGFTRAFSHGHLRRLKTTSELLTGSVWPTFYGAASPGEHGIYHHLQWDPDSMGIRRVSEDWLYTEPFWYDAARRSASITVCDVPMMFPSRLASRVSEAGLARNVEIVNWGSHDQLGGLTSNRPELLRELIRRFRRHPMGPEIPVRKNSGQLKRIRDDLLSGVKRKGALLQWLMQATDWDMFLGVFGETHRGGHILWPEMSKDTPVPPTAMLEVYQAIDRELSALTASIDRKHTQIILFSLHGMETNRSQEHFVPKVMDRLNDSFADLRASDEPASGQRSLMRRLRESVPAGLQHAIARRVPVAVRDWVVSRATSGGYDWATTPGLSLLADYNGYIRFNLAGRESQGCLAPGSHEFNRYDKLIDETFSSLVTEPDAQPLVAKVVNLQSRLQGSRSHLLPDRVVTWHPDRPAEQARSPSIGPVAAEIETGRSGNHRHEGFALVLGTPSDQERSQIQNMTDIVDLARYLKTRLMPAADR